MELFEQMRREYELGVGTIRGVARKFGVHRRMVRDAFAGCRPPARKSPPRKRPRLGPARAFIDRILQDRPEGTAQAASHRSPYLVRMRQEMPRWRWRS